MFHYEPPVPRFFEKGLIYPYTQLQGFYFIDNPKNALPPQWLQRNSFVFLDFKGDSDERQFDDLWCLVPITVKTTNTLALRIARIDFVEMTKNKVLPSYLIRNCRKIIFTFNCFFVA